MVIHREISDSVLRAARKYPVVAITGPRQSGKTTLAKELFGKLPYVLLEEPDTRRFALEDPRGFLAQYPDGVVLDEAQRAPELFSYLQGMVDDDPRPGRFVLTGSQHFGLLSTITQSLAGRVAMMTLLPFSWGELRAAKLQDRDLSVLLHDGLYPPIRDRRIDATDWLANYVATYVERDVRQLVNVKDLRAFETFLKMCAARCGQLVNLSSLANDCGVTHNTAKSWLSVLEASFVVRTLAPHSKNYSKRLVKTPKLYFLDPGLAAWLLDIRSPNQLANHAMRGALFETWVYSELLKGAYNQGMRPSLYFWRDRAGLEVDFLVDHGGTLQPIEAKSGQTFATDWLKGLQRWSAIAGDDVGRQWLVHGGNLNTTRSGVRCVPWTSIGDLVSGVTRP